LGIVFQDTVENVGDVFLGHSVYAVSLPTQNFLLQHVFQAVIVPILPLRLRFGGFSDDLVRYIHLHTYFSFNC